MLNEEIVLKEGIVLKERYIIGKIIGHGGCGITYLAKDLNQKELTVVVKQFAPNSSTHKKEKSAEVVAALKIAFEKEASFLKKLGDSYRFIPKRYDFFGENGNLYIVQEFIKGVDLNNILVKGDIFSELETIELIKKILILLQDLHTKNIIHRDIKPSNIRVREINEDEDELILIDFGISKEALDNNEIGLVTDMGLGTEGYRPPEKATSVASDIYPIGIIGLQAITGLTARELTGRGAIELQLVKDGKILPNARIQATPKFIDFLKYTLASDLDFDLRYSNATEALKDLNNLDQIVPFDIAAKARENTVTEGNLSSKPTSKRSKPSITKVISLVGSLITIGTAIHIGWTYWWVKVTNVSSETSPYENKKYNIKLEYPNNWDKKEPEIPDIITREVVKFTQPSSSNNGIVPTVSITIRPVNNEQDTLEKLIKSETDGIDKSSVIKRGRPTISGREAYIFIYTVVDENSVVTEYLKTFFKTDNNIYVITYSSNKADFDNFTKVVDNMIKSIKVKSSSRS
jgi:eukaryotic-like serine/threonine-protein kinase